MLREGISAVILSAHPVDRCIDGLEVVNYVSRFSDAAGLLNARIDSIGRVKTRHFFWLDYDDMLPDDYLDVLDECLLADKPLVYTREEVRTKDGWVKRYAAPYSAEEHAGNPMFVHHLALCDTRLAALAWQKLPRGCYAPEPLLYYELARAGVAFVDRVGYRWNRTPGGLSHYPDILFSQFFAYKYNLQRLRDSK